VYRCSVWEPGDTIEAFDGFITGRTTITMNTRMNIHIEPSTFVGIGTKEKKGKKLIDPNFNEKRMK
jgi:hypothetical protein